MKKTKETFVFGFALFAGFFGAGNLILPPSLGFKSGPDWWLVALGFLASTTLIPLFAIAAHAKLQGTMFDFGKKVSPLFSSVFCFIMLGITITLPCPRTAAVTHEIAIAPLFKTDPLLTSVVYFSLAFLFVINRSRVLNVIGKFLTPIILIILFAIISIGICSPLTEINASSLQLPIVKGLLEGYQTYDAMAGVIMGGVVLASLNSTFPKMHFTEKRTIVFKSGIIAMVGLFVVYVGLIFIGAKYNTHFNTDISRTNLLLGITNKTLGGVGVTFLGVLVALACFTTAVAIIISVADFSKVYFPKFKNAYAFTAVFCCLTGVVMGQMDVKYIIDIAVPALMFIYPMCITLILLNVLPEKFVSKLMFRWCILVVFIFSIPDFLGFLITSEKLKTFKNLIPFGEDNLGWLLPVFLTFVIVNFIRKVK